MTNQETKSEFISVQKRNKTYLVPTGAVLALVGASSAHAEVTYPTLDFSAIPFGVWVAAVMAFVLMAGMAFIGLSALISVLRKSRGAVR